ncbi:MAG: class II fructose-bisphosphate aldolase [bacterium]|nr:class II fructose-bisphosphate aldolase [bacterium]MDZ4295945.1 class II fructose-bisphosphate aldolase [Patescibacteria group bacterium]
MVSLQELFENARAGQYAVGHFNVASLEMFRAVALAARETGVPGVMIGTSEGEREFMGLRQAVALTRVFAEECGIRLVLNADHSKSVGAAKDAIDAGYPSVHFDGSGLAYEDNVRQTREVVSYARERAAGREEPGMSIEGELGYIGGSSAVTSERVVVTAEQMTDPVKAGDYVQRTGVDRLAIAIGNVHGLNLEEPRLDFERLAAIRAAVPDTCALVLHAGSGIGDADIRKAINLGIVNIHISTELRKAYREVLEESLRERAGEYAPYKLAKPAVQAVKEVVEAKLRLFGRP